MAENVVGSILARIRADASQMIATFARAKKQAGGFTKSLETIGAGFTTAAALTAGFGIAIGVVAKVTGDFEQTMANVGAVTGATGSAMEDLAGIALELGKSTVFSASQAGEAMFELGSAGVKTANDFRNILTPALDLAAATQSEISDATKAVVGNVRAFGLSFSDAGRVANIFSAANENSALTLGKLSSALRPVAPFVSALGISIEDTSAAIGVLVNKNIQAEAAGTGLRAIFASLISPVGEAAKILDEAGLSVDKLGKLIKDPVKLMRELKAANLSAKDATKIFGREAVSMFFALQEGVDDMEALRDSITGTDSASRIATKQLDTFNSQVKLMKSALEALVITIGNNLLPVFREWVERATEVIGTVIKFVEANGELVKGLILGTGKFLIITTTILGVSAALAKIIIIAPRIVAALVTITATIPWALLATAISLIIIKLLNLSEAWVDARNAAADADNTNEGLAKNARALAGFIKSLTDRNISLKTAYREAAQQGFVVNELWKDQQLTVKQLIQLAEVQERQAAENEQKKKERAAAEKERLDIALEEEKVRLAELKQIKDDNEKAAINADDLRTANMIDNFIGLSTAGTNFFESQIKGTKSAEDAFNDFAKSIKDTFIRAIAGMIARAITFLAIVTTLKLLGINLGGGGVGKLGRKFITGFAQGGIIGAQGGLLPPGEDMLVAAQTGEAILTRQAVRDLGGSAAIQEINAGRGAPGGDTLIFNIRSITGRPEQSDIDFIRQAVNEGRRQSAGAF